MSSPLTKEHKQIILDTLKKTCIIEGKESGTTIITITTTDGGINHVTKETKTTFK